MSAFVDEVCERAWSIMLPAIRVAADADVINKYAGTVVVIDPEMAYEPGLDLEDNAVFMACIDTNHPKWESYKAFAYAKAQLSWRTGLSSRDVQETAPQLYRRGDVKWGGSVVHNGLIVAFSGAQPWYDEWIAGAMADLIIAMCRNEVNIMMADQSDFVR